MSLTLFAFLWTIGCITHNTQDLETQDSHCTTVTFPEKKIYTSIRKRLLFPKMGEDEKSKRRTDQTAKAFKNKNCL